MLDQRRGAATTGLLASADDLLRLPTDLPEPEDDGAAGHLLGMALPVVRLRATDCSVVDLAGLPFGRSVLFIYPMTGQPGRPLPPGWDGVPGARGCTSELCGVRDELERLRRAGVSAVFGLSTQDRIYQAEAASRLALSYPLLADPTRTVGLALRLPTFSIGATTFYRRLTLIVHDGVIEHVFYPVFPPDTHVAEVIAWLERRRRAGRI